MVALPFSLDVSLPTTTFSGEVRIVIECVEAVGDGPPRPSEEVVSLFATAVTRQLFTDPAARREARCEVLSFRREREGAVARFTLEMESYDPVSVLVLVSLLAQVSFAGDMISRVAIAATTSAPDSGAEALFARLDEFRDLKVSRSMPFHVELSDGVAPFSCAAFTFMAPISPDQFEELRIGFDVWGHIVHLGGYLFDFVEQGEFTTEFGRTAHLAPARVEHVWDTFEGWNGAFEPLINLAVQCHRTGMPVKSVALW